MQKKEEAISIFSPSPGSWPRRNKVWLYKHTVKVRDSTGLQGEIHQCSGAGDAVHNYSLQYRHLPFLLERVLGWRPLYGGANWTWVSEKAWAVFISGLLVLNFHSDLVRNNHRRCPWSESCDQTSKKHPKCDKLNDSGLSPKPETRVSLSFCGFESVRTSTSVESHCQIASGQPAQTWVLTTSCV